MLRSIELRFDNVTEAALVHGELAKRGMDTTLVPQNTTEPDELVIVDLQNSLVNPIRILQDVIKSFKAIVE